LLYAFVGVLHQQILREKLPKDVPMKGLRRKDEAMKTYRWYQKKNSRTKPGIV